MSTRDTDVLGRLISAEQDERRRLALFLHDGPVQQLAGIALMLDGALHAIAGGRNEEALGIIEGALSRQRDTIRELRDLSFVLEPVVLRDQGLLPALRALADQVGGSHGIAVELDAAGVAAAGEATRVALYTIIRELLEQAVRRGPPARIRIAVVESAEGGLNVSVSDDAEPERRRRWLEAIEERARQLHGTVDVLPRAEGTEVCVTLPAHTARR